MNEGKPQPQPQDEVHFTLARAGEPMKTWKFSTLNCPRIIWDEVCRFMMAMERQYKPDVITIEAKAEIVT